LRDTIFMADATVSSPARHDPPARKPPTPRAYQYYDLLMAAFVTVQVCCQLISASKAVRIGSFSFGAGAMFFPLSYIFGDVLTEVYGYARSRKVIWAGFGALAFATFMSRVVLGLPADPSWSHQDAWETVFGNSWRIALASLLAFLAGEWVNSVTLARMKVRTRGRHLWMRTIGSTIVGEAVDSVIFYPLAFLGVWPGDLVWRVLAANYTLKVAMEVVLTPMTYRVVAFLKRAEDEDFYDVDTDFSPLPRMT
jgi:uncharacterized integral membrane protein (TIGR00697 family)